jgi:hypothetical protein
MELLFPVIFICDSCKNENRIKLLVAQAVPKSIKCQMCNHENSFVLPYTDRG